MSIRVRFAPSPTGNLHVGGARTALFNYLFAKSSGGKMVLRIEDTDSVRSTDEATEAIYKGLGWLGLVADEGPFFQSERTLLYREKAKELLAAGHAYRCYMSEDELKAYREEKIKNKEKPKYPGTYRPAQLSAQPSELPDEDSSKSFVIRLRAPQEGQSVFEDKVLGSIVTPNQELDDFIIIRSDGSPTYNFTVVVDDIDMKITHVIRGMDHISNTPKQLILYGLFGEQVPVFAHVPMILGKDKKKLSKRHGATSVFEYRDEGYMRDAFVNYLARLGWGHGDQEIFSRSELESLFSLEKIGKSAAVFDLEKLLWVNMEHIKGASFEEIFSELEFFLPEKNKDEKNKDVEGRSVSSESFKTLVSSLQERSKSLSEIASACSWYFVDSQALSYDEKSCKKHLKEESLVHLKVLKGELSLLDDFSELHLEKVVSEVVQQLDIKLGKLAQPLRVATTGSSVSPPIYTVLEILGKDESLARLSRVLEGGVVFSEHQADD